MASPPLRTARHLPFDTRTPPRLAAFARRFLEYKTERSN
jgi:hypothetical protein